MQKYLLYWHKSANTDAEMSEQLSEELRRQDAAMAEWEVLTLLALLVEKYKY